MKVSNRVGMFWAIAVFLVVGLVLVVVAMTQGGDETDMEDQPEGAPAFGLAADPRDVA